MTTRLSVDETVDALGHGRVVVFPTDTVYGVAASVWSLVGVAGVFALKRRPIEVALPILVSGVEDLAELDVELNEPARRLAAAFWPGALTMFVWAPSARARTVGASTNSVGLRVPHDQALLALLRETGPLVVTSANEHGRAPCESAEEVLAVFEGREGWAGVYDGGERHGVVSTVVDLTSAPWRVLRHGALSESSLAEEISRPGAPS